MHVCVILIKLPLVVNPELYHPERHFAFAADGSVRGLTTQAQTEGKINDDTFNYTLKDIFSKALTDASSPQVPYARLNWFLFRFFEPFFIDPLGPKAREVVRRAFRLFLENKL